MKFTLTIVEHPNLLTALIQSEDGQQCNLHSSEFCPDSVEEKRWAMDNFYLELLRLVRGKQFPEHTVRFGMRADGKSAEFLGYPDAPTTSTLEPKKSPDFFS